ncbi:TetR/AcrR family transcriptional regulator [Ideonella sp. A 288]|uniref:TetR/AcrR family transcriptional regulator n=1 Tax=Ideonella sp. A 288 TaxID=1962181 RepID=UPI000B4A9BA9|nr:TetR/AcrR family transcriptional regulator [Ideonella sp. A 288]
MNATDAPHRRRRKDERPQELLDAALELFVEKGFASTRTDEVALKAGVSKGTLYLYFPSKEDLLKAVIAQHLSDRISEGAALAAGFSGSSAQLLRDLLTTWWTQLYDSPASGVFKLVITEVRNFPEIADYYHREVVERAHVLLGGVIQQGIDRGEFRAVDVNVAVHSLVFPLIMLCLHKHSLGACAPCSMEIDGHRFIPDHINLLLDGLCAPGGRVE